MNIVVLHKNNPAGCSLVENYLRGEHISIEDVSEDFSIGKEVDYVIVDESVPAKEITKASLQTPRPVVAVMSDAAMELQDVATPVLLVLSLKQAAEQVMLAAGTTGIITLVGGPANPQLRKAAEQLRKMNVQYQSSNAPRGGCRNIMFVPLGEKIVKQDRFFLYVPVGEDTSKLAKMMHEALWVAPNCAEQAAVAMAQIAGFRDAVQKVRK